MSNLGQILLIAVFLLCGLAAAFGLAALKLKIETAKKAFLWARRAMFTAAGLAVVALLLAFAAFLTDDFSITAVARFSSTQLPFFYKLSAVWAGSAGSLLLWSVAMFILFGLWLIANSESQIANSNRRYAISDLRFNTIALCIGAGVCLGFSALLIFVAKPFAGSPVAMDDGAGLNPLLQNFWMIIHPPLLFVGYSAFLIPFVVASAGVFAARAKDPALYVQLRRWLLAGICFLSLGIATGARWSYLELGWGGYWAWDPVENVSLLPWLAAAAALHSSVARQVADRFTRWTVVLAPVPFILCLLATLVTRSGVLSSLHSFDQNVMFSALSAFIGCCFLLWLACVIRAVKDISISPSRRISAFILDKADTLYWANLVFIFTAVIIAAATFWPIIWPAVSQAIRRVVTISDSSFTLTREFYNQVISIIGIVLAFLVGLGALTDRQRYRGFVLVVMACCGVGLVCSSFVFKSGEKQLLPALAYGACAFSFIAVLAKLWLDLKTRNKISAGIAHLGLLLLVVTAGLSSKERSVQARLARAEKITIGKYEFVYDSFERKSFENVNKAGPEILVGKVRKKPLTERLWPHKTKPGTRSITRVATLWPHNNLYSNGQTTTEVAVRTGLLEDVYISFDGVDQDGRVQITAKVKPLMLWLWFSFVLIVSGSALALFERERSVKSKAEDIKTIM